MLGGTRAGEARVWFGHNIANSGAALYPRAGRLEPAKTEKSAT